MEREDRESESVDEKHLIRVAGMQAGAISTAQLMAAGCSRRVIDRRVRRGLLERRHRGVYAYGAILGPRFAEWAAFLACGPRTVLSRVTALALCDLAPRPSIVDVTLPSGSRGHDGVRVHRATVEPHEILWIDRLPVTAPARTLRDDEPSLTRSEAERRMLALIRAARLPAPATNVRVRRHEVDMLWREERLIVEIDGFAFHSSRAAFERDRIRDAELQALGYRVLRITWRQLTDEPEAVVALLAGALSAARSA